MHAAHRRDLCCGAACMIRFDHSLTGGWGRALGCMKKMPVFEILRVLGVLEVEPTTNL
jgi:hypothetical protein